MSEKTVTINSRKFDGRIHRSWSAEVVSESPQLWVFVGEFDVEVKHEHLGVIRRGTKSFEYYWKNKWFNVFRFHEPEGELRNYYCNINMPPVYKAGVLDYVDLDIDILVWKDFSKQSLDHDEFEENSRKYKYPESIRAKALESLAELEILILNQDFPFDYGRGND